MPKKPPQLDLPQPTPIDDGDFVFHVPLHLSTVRKLLLELAGHDSWGTFSNREELDELIVPWLLRRVEEGPQLPVEAITNFVHGGLNVDVAPLIVTRDPDMIFAFHADEELHMFAVPATPEQVTAIVAALLGVGSWQNVMDPETLNQIVVGWLSYEASLGTQPNPELVDNYLRRLFESETDVAALARQTQTIAADQAEPLPELELAEA